jgi:hypothetical protein
MAEKEALVEELSKEVEGKEGRGGDATAISKK